MVEQLSLLGFETEIEKFFYYMDFGHLDENHHRIYRFPNGFGASVFQTDKYLVAQPLVFDRDGNYCERDGKLNWKSSYLQWDVGVGNGGVLNTLDWIFSLNWELFFRSQQSWIGFGQPGHGPKGNFMKEIWDEQEALYDSKI
ncbi:hypothetical protein [Enterococcus sp.]|uniref:hypothetical protein n=1 Tax=Enterococcus sp. TaxID=35783 RepID=UPI003C71C80F